MRLVHIWVPRVPRILHLCISKLVPYLPVGGGDICIWVPRVPTYIFCVCLCNGYNGSQYILCSCLRGRVGGPSMGTTGTKDSSSVYE